MFLKTTFAMVISLLVIGGLALSIKVSMQHIELPDEPCGDKKNIRYHYYDKDAHIVKYVCKWEK